MDFSHVGRPPHPWNINNDLPVQSKEASMILAGFIFCVNLVVWPGYLQRIKVMEEPARQLDELFSPSAADTREYWDQSHPFFFFGTKTKRDATLEELEVRGIDPQNFSN